MSACNTLYTMCSSNSVSEAFPDICQSSAATEGIPPMTMWFHQRVQEVILFVEWIPRTTGAYIGSWIAVFFMAVVTQGLKVRR